jgi:hypothetical protein
MRPIFRLVVLTAALALLGTFGQPITPTRAAAPGKHSIPVHRIGKIVARDLPLTATTGSHPVMPHLGHNKIAPAGRGLPPATAPARSAPRAAVVSTPPLAVQTAFGGLTEAGDSAAFGGAMEPPDPWVAVGPTAVVQSVNSLIRMTDRSGHVTAQTTVDSFFGIVPNEITFSDPRIVYDAPHNRWIGTILSYDCSNGYLYLAVSQSGDPLGAWTLWDFTYAGFVPDFPGLGSSSDKIVVSANEYAINPAAPGCVDSSPTTASLLVVDWAAAEGVGSLNDVYFSEPGYFAWRPAPNLSPDPAVYVVGERLSDGDVSYARITGDVANPNAPGPDPTPVTLFGPIDINAIAPFTPPIAPRQPGFPSTIATAVDERPTDAVWDNGTLSFVSTYPLLLSGDSEARDTVRVTQIQTGSVLTVKQDFAIGFVGYDTYMGGIGIAKDGTAYFVYSTSSPSAYVSTWASVQKTTDASDTNSNPILVASGMGSYQGSRWGDFVGVALDPAVPNAVWTADEYPTASGDWATRVTELAIDAHPPVGTVKINGGATATASSSISLSVAATDDVSGVKEVLVSNDPGMAGATTFPYSPTVPWVLPAGDGRRSVYVQWRDRLANISAISTASIVVDTVVPTSAMGASSITKPAMTSSTAVLVHLAWAGSDARTGVASFRLLRSIDGGAFALLAQYSGTTTSVSTYFTAGHRYQFEVEAVDRAGNVGSPAVGPQMLMSAVGESSRSITYRSTWTLQSVRGAFGGRTRYTARRGATATYRFSGRSIAWVAPKSLARGSAKVYVDGVYRGTISLYSRTTRARQVVFAQTWASVGTHTIKLVVLGTLHHPRVDLDAFVVLR